MRVSGAPLLDGIDVANDFEFSLGNEKSFFDGRNPEKKHPSFQVPAAGDMQVKTSIYRGLLLNLWQEILENNQQLLFDDFLLMHTGLNGLTPRVTDFIPSNLPPRQPTFTPGGVCYVTIETQHLDKYLEMPYLLGRVDHRGWRSAPSLDGRPQVHQIYAGGSQARDQTGGISLKLLLQARLPSSGIMTVFGPHAAEVHIAQYRTY
jgi:hypothetical protein